jgi:hypothetical protein
MKHTKANQQRKREFRSKKERNVANYDCDCNAGGERRGRVLSVTAQHSQVLYRLAVFFGRQLFFLRVVIC